VAVLCLIAYKYVKKPYGWGIQQVLRRAHPPPAMQFN
jgi:hypothetical protein